MAKDGTEGIEKDLEKDLTKDLEKETKGYSGSLLKVDKPDPDADKLAERIGGESRVKFENDPDGREFDAISDEYVAQAKPANFVANKKFRVQAKATFEGRVTDESLGALPVRWTSRPLRRDRAAGVRRALRRAAPCRHRAI